MIETAEIATLKPKTNSYLTEDNDEDRITKCRKKFDIERKLKFEDYKHCLEATQLKNGTIQLENTN